jgi:hypothetical protein
MRSARCAYRFRNMMSGWLARCQADDINSTSQLFDLMKPLQKLDIQELIRLANVSTQVDAACSCATTLLSSWESVPVSFPEAQMREVGTLVDDPYDEATFVEYHPSGSRYESASAPISPRHYPYNRCTVAACQVCGRHFLRYTEAGGYFVDKRIRSLNPDLIIDAAVA